MNKKISMKSTIAMLLSITAVTFANASDDVKGKTRQDVINEMIEARNKGLLDFNGDNYPDYGKELTSGPGNSRQKVIDEMIVYRKAGLLQIHESDYPQNIEEVMTIKASKNTQ